MKFRPDKTRGGERKKGKTKKATDTHPTSHGDQRNGNRQTRKFWAGEPQKGERYGGVTATKRTDRGLQGAKKMGSVSQPGGRCRVSYAATPKHGAVGRKRSRETMEPGGGERRGRQGNG